MQAGLLVKYILGSLDVLVDEQEHLLEFAATEIVEIGALGLLIATHADWHATRSTCRLLH